MVDMTLVSLLKDGMEIASPVIQGVVSAIMAAVFLRGNTSNQEFELIKAHKFGEAIEMLLSNNRMTYFELYKCRNFMKVARLADEFIKEDSSKPINEEFDIDWFMRFFDAVGNISNEELQLLWGRVLAGEVSNPGLCSLRTLDLIRNLSKSEARSFEALSRLVLVSGDSQFIFPTGFYDENQGDSDCIKIISQMSLHYGKDIIPLLESGLLTRDHDIAIYLKKKQKLEIHNAKLFCAVENARAKEVLFQQEAFLLTSSGLEVYSIIQRSASYSVDTEYASACFRYLQKSNTDLVVTTFEI